MTQHFVAKTLCAVTLDTANADQKAVLDAALKQVGFIPNMHANMVNVPGVLTSYLHGYSAFRQNSGLSPGRAGSRVPRHQPAERLHVLYGRT